jgi:hypothetical protein
MLAVLLLFPRYDFYPGRGDAGLYRVDRWTGSIDYCGAVCGHVPDKTGSFN